MKDSRVPALAIASVSVYAALYAQAGEPQPKLRLAEVQNVSPSRYRVDLTLDPAKTQFSGAIEIALEIREALQTLWLNAADIAVTEAALTAKGQAWPAKAQPGTSGFLALHFDRTIPPGPAELRIRYTGNVRQRDSSAVFRVDDLGNHY